MLELFAPRRIAVPDLRPRQRRHRCGSGARYSVRARKLTPAEESTLRALAATRSLRALAADFGVSHETVRTIARVGPSGSTEQDRLEAERDVTNAL